MATEKERKEMTVRIVSITFDTEIEGQSKKYAGTEIVYKTHENKVQSKGIATTAFKYNPVLRKDLEALAAGDYVHVVYEKGDFVNWISAKKVDAPAQQEHIPAEEPKKGTAAQEFDKDTPKDTGHTQAKTPYVAPTPIKEAVRSNYETPEERAKRQVMIVRQSSITAALKLFEIGGAGGGQFVPDEAQVIASAQIFEAYVLGHDYTETIVNTEPLLPE